VLADVLLMRGRRVQGKDAIGGGLAFWDGWLEEKLDKMGGNPRLGGRV
jgi:hypothetical protein